MSDKGESTFPDFSGKCVSFALQDEDSCNDLSNPRFEYQGNRLFVVGTIPKGATTSNWAVNCQAAIAWERVTDYIVFDNEQAFIEATKTSEDYDKNNQSND